MQQIVHIANTDVEFELAGATSPSIEKSWNSHPLCLQLQFLPLLYAEPEDLVAVTTFPSDNYMEALHQTGWWKKGLPKLTLLKEIEPFLGKSCISWGPSKQVQAWAEERQMAYFLPKNWQTVCLVNSKTFSFRYTSLPEAALLQNKHGLLEWIKKIPGTKVLKTCFGLSGHGNRCFTDLSEDILHFCNKEWGQKRPVIGEPWLDRLEDFSTQWFIHSDQKIEWIGATRFETDSRGNYLSTLAGPENILFASHSSFLKQHLQVAEQALQEIAEKGFFGFVGIDAFLYRHRETQTVCLYPLVEINARQTMSLVALRLQKRLCPQHLLRFQFQSQIPSNIHLLPSQLVDNQGKMVSFKKNVAITPQFLSD